MLSHRTWAALILAASTLLATAVLAYPHRAPATPAAPAAPAIAEAPAAPATPATAPTPPSRSRRTWLGVVTQSLDDDLREGLDYKGDGLLVNSVADESPAAKAGIKHGDVIVSMNGKEVSSPEDLQDMVRSAQAGERAQLEIVRDGKHQTLSTTLGERPDRMSWGDDRHHIVIREAPEAEMRVERLPEMPDMPEIPEMPLFGRGRLGVQLQDLNPDLGGYFSVPDGKGALIVEVVKDSPASRAGLKSGDVIVRVGERDVQDSDAAARAIREQEGKIPIVVMRKGQRSTMTAELEARTNRVKLMRDMGEMEMDRLPGELRVMARDHRESDLHREMQQLREEIRQLREQLKQKSQN